MQGKLYALITVFFKCLIGRETGTFDQALTAVLVPEGKFLIHKLQNELQLLLRSFFKADLCDPARKEQLPACAEYPGAEIFFHLWCHHDALPPSFRNASSYTASDGPISGGV